MKGYWIVLGSPVTDIEAQRLYADLWAPIAAQYHARLIADGGSLALLEGEGIARLLLVEFPSLAVARACYEDPDYAAAKVQALAASNRTLIILEGAIA